MVTLPQGKDQLTAEEMAKLARQTGFIGEQLCNDELVRQTDILRENLNYLLSAPGEKGRLAAFAGVHQNAVTRWLAGIQPNAAHKRRIQAFFGLPAEVDLAQEPLFLSLSPVTVQQQKEWLHQQIDELTPEILRALFPALAKLLR